MNNLLRSAAALLLAGAATQAQTVISDKFDVTNVGTGFALGEGVNSEINPPATRMTGSAVDGLSYLNRATKATTAYSIDANGKVRVTSGAQSGRFTLTGDGVNPFDFSTALGLASATPSAPVTYDVTISMDNNATSPGTQRVSFALGTEEGTTAVWDFGLQLHRAVATDTFASVSKRIDTGSSGLAADQNAVMFAMPAGTVGDEVNFLLRVTDAGAETTTFSSRVQLSIDGGNSWAYDTSTDASLVNGWRFDGTERFFMFDIASNDKFITYDNFSVVVPEPSVTLLGLVGGLTMLFRRRRSS